GGGAARRWAHARLVARPDLLVRRPPRPAMRRPRLFDALDAGLEGRLVLISAPAGAGKTALLSTWLDTRPRKRVAWMSLRPRRGERAVLGALPRGPPRGAARDDGPGDLPPPPAGAPARLLRPALHT